LVTLLMLALPPKHQSWMGALMWVSSQPRVKEWWEVLIPCLLTKPSLHQKC
jgi:hypothetical protein